MGSLFRNNWLKRAAWGIAGFLTVLMLLEPAGLMAKSGKQKAAAAKMMKGPLVPHKTFPADCGLCHVAKRWDVLREDFSFDHEKMTGYKLEGAHARAACLRCHNDRGPVKVYTARGCGGCHSDPHKSSFGSDCTRCHDQNTWNVAGANATHAKTRFLLTGAHLSIVCERCHVNAPSGNFRGLSPDCFSCHQAKYQQAPNHVKLSYPHNCETCHNTDAWPGAKFNHNFVAGQACIQCHQDKFDVAPNHIAGNYPKTCQDCHNTSSWAGARFDHRFLAGTPCAQCHLDKFSAAPNHVAMNFPKTCETCHNTTSWAGASFNHTAVTGQACIQCHQAQFNTAPNHVAGNFPKTCQDCHNTTSWASAGFDHGTIGATPCMQCHLDKYNSAPNHAAHSYPLTCQSCHNTTSWTSATFNHSVVTGQACVQCHLDKFTSAPNHVSLGFPQTCQNCHNTTAWTPSTFNHTAYFPLSSAGGNHNVSCTICHNAGSTAVFTCLTSGCHSQAVTDGHHTQVPGYSYSSIACYQCHPNGTH